jgi:histidyl-tRNA synthetase
MTRTEPARGMRDFLPEDVRRREYVIGVIKRVYERYGYEPLETPARENLETLMGKYGDEGNQLIFKILKRGEHEASGRPTWRALRPDRAAGARHRAPPGEAAASLQALSDPAGVAADRPARGRFREFYQCDVDFLGSTSPWWRPSCARPCQTCWRSSGFGDFKIRVNHRQLLTSLLKMVGHR